MSDFSRRQFLHNSLLAAAAAGAAGPVSKLFAAEAAVAERGPNEKLRFAVIGVHGQGGEHVKNLLHGLNKGEADIVAICDVDDEVGNKKCDEIAKATGGQRPKYVKDLRQIYDDKNIDCVSAALPNHWHALAAIWAMQAGKDIYTEKPAAHNISEGQRMVETARKYNRICQIGTQSRSMKGTQDAIQFMRDGKIGEVNLARGLCFKSRMSIGPAGDYAVPSNLDYNLWRGPAPMASTSPYQGKKDKGGQLVPVHYDWHWNWLFGNGDLGNQGVHEMDVAQWGLGVNQLANGVLTYGGRFGYEDAGNTPNTEVAVLDYGPKTLVFEMHGLTNKPFKRLKGVEIGIIFEGKDGYVAMTEYTKGKAFDKDGKEIANFDGGQYPEHHNNFIKAVRSRKKEDLNCDVAEGVRSASLCHMANISYRLGKKMSNDDIVIKLEGVKMSDNAKATLDRTIEHLKDNGVKVGGDTLFQCGDYLTFDPKSEDFADSKANELKTREYRAPFTVPAEGKV